MTKTTKKVSWQDMLFWLGVTIVLLLSTKKSFSLPFYWDTAWFLVPAGYAIAQTGNLFSYFGGSDYPHTFLLPLIIAFIIKLTTNHLFFIHLLSLFLSLFFLVVMYFLGKSIASKKIGQALVVLFLTNPLFIAQTHLVYFEIVGAALRFLSVIFLIKKKYFSFTLIAILAILFRVDNALFITLAAGVYLFLEKGITNKLSWLIRYISPLPVMTVVWLYIHASIAGWWVYSPERFYDEQPWQSLWDAITYITVRQGRYLISGSSVVMLMFSKKLIKTIKEVITLALVLGAVSLPTLLMITKLGYLLPRHILPILPVFYLLFLALLQVFIKKPMVFWAIIILLSIVQYQYRYDCYAGNLEDCLSVLNLIKQQ
ncbi:MAG: hypothetical protein UX28_C0001G0051 [Candidatus Pacebacteria bacterium GW2011_GWA1_46_10]|nr:MAG: hypothetical protein UX28_C0001G0051 [Candidatus Pacebacteria bacterium GW2011_GWA1_46_10]